MNECLYVCMIEDCDFLFEVDRGSYSKIKKCAIYLKSFENYCKSKIYFFRITRFKKIMLFLQSV